MSGAARGPSRPRRAQHFLRRGALARSVAEVLDAGHGGTVVDIGAGTGRLTAELAPRFHRVVAVELDGRLCARLRSRFAGEPKVDVVEADFFDLRLPTEPWCVVANLPFHETSAILRSLVDAPRPPTDIVVIVEDRAARRYAGSPWAPESLRSLWLKPWWHAAIVRDVPRREFDPPPSVDCALLWLSGRARPLVPDGQASLYRDFIAACFGRRGEDVAAGMRVAFGREQLRRLARALRFDPHGRASDLDFERWLALFRFFAREADESKRRAIRGARRRLPRSGIGPGSND